MATAQVNATLTGVYDAGGLGEWRDDPAPGAPRAGAARWEGAAGCYLDRKRRTARTQPEVERYVEETLLVDLGDPAGISYEAGDVLTIVARGQARTVEVDDVVDPDPPDGDADALLSAGVATAALVLRRVGQA